MRKVRERTRWLLRAAAVLVVLAAGFALISDAADHRDGPVFGPPGITITNSRRDINDVYIFRSPANAANTVLVLTVSPFSAATTPNTFDQSIALTFKIDTTGDFVEDIQFRTTFGAPDGTGVQQVTLRGLPATRFPANGGILARGNTRSNLPVAGGGLFRAADQDDAFFFDGVGFNQLLNGGAFPRPVGTATNFFGPNVNTLTLTLEIPSTVLGGDGALINYWGTTDLNGRQIDRMGRPGINVALIPPVPRGSNFPIGQGGRIEMRNAFNFGQPRNDQRDFTNAMQGILRNFFGRTQADAATLSGLLLPDVLSFEVGNPSGFGTFIGPGGSILGNGRRLRDDVIDFTFTVLTNGAITTDNVPDDNGTRITDGNMGTTAAFPYVGPPNDPAQPLSGTPPPP